jgi:uncharacterized protein YkwD
LILRQILQTQITILTLSGLLPFGFISAKPSFEFEGSDIGVPVVQSQTVQSSEFIGCSPQSASIINETFEQEVVDLVNAERTSRGIPPLKRIYQLDEASRYHAADMEQDIYFKHDTYDRVSNDIYKVCDWYTRIDGFYLDRSWLGENIAIGYSTPSSVISAWMNSPGHRENILRQEFWEIGVGYYSGNHWVQDFGKRPGNYPIIINNEAAKTDNTIVSIYLYGDNNTWDEIRLRNNDDPWSPWAAFQNNLTWQIPERAGEHIVTVEMRNKNWTTTSSDSIYLDIPAYPELGSIPEEIMFIYSLPDQRSAPSIKQFIPQNIGNDETIFWEISSDVDWLSISPMAGSTPDPVTIAVSGTFTDTANPDSGTLTITTVSPTDVLHPSQVITVSLTIIDTPFETLYLPTVMRASP